MSYRLIVRAAAENDLLDAQRWYESQRAGLGAEFRAAFSRIAEVLGESPLLYPVVHRNARRAVMGRFPYVVYFVVIGNTIEVAACLHGKRHPVAFKRRIRR